MMEDRELNRPLDPPFSKTTVYAGCAVGAYGSGGTQPGEERRREFLRDSSLILAGAVPGALRAAGSEPTGSGAGRGPIRIALVGCGYRGLQLSQMALRSGEVDVRLVALVDFFEDRIQQVARTLNGRFPEQIDLTDVQRFAGRDGLRRVLELEFDGIILATPPVFRPSQVGLAVEAGMPVFAERPIAVDAHGVCRFQAACQAAQQKALAVATGFQHTASPRFSEMIERLREGAIGRFTYARTYSNRPPLRTVARRANQSEFEYQLRNWRQFVWLSGDVLLESHAPFLEVINALHGSVPLEVVGTGGRNASRKIGQSFDQYHLEYRYPGGFRLISMCRQTPDCWQQQGEFIHGTEGWCDLAAGKIYDLDDQLLWESQSSGDGAGLQFERWLASLGAGEQLPIPLTAIDATLTAVLGRAAAYSGNRVRWRELFTKPVFEQPSAQFPDPELGATRLLDLPAVTLSPDGTYPLPDKTYC